MSVAKALIAVAPLKSCPATIGGPHAGAAPATVAADETPAGRTAATPATGSMGTTGFDGPIPLGRITVTSPSAASPAALAGAGDSTSVWKPLSTIAVRAAPASACRLIT